MSGVHEPREEFVDQLERQVRAELRRWDLAAQPPRWLPQSRLAAAAAVLVVVLASMAAGGAVVAAAYQTRLNGQRDMLLGTLEQRAKLAQQRLALAGQQVDDLTRRVSVGIASPESLPDARFKVTEADAEVKTIALEIEEVRASGRESMHTLSAPLVSGRDFVTERLRVQMSVRVAAAELERTRAQSVQTRVEVGMADPADAQAARSRVFELEAAVAAVQRKLEIRQAFIKGSVPAALADLQGLEAETVGRRTALARRIEISKQQVQDLRGRIEVGTANPLKLAEAEMRLQELQLELSKADYDLLLIRQQLGK